MSVAADLDAARAALARGDHAAAESLLADLLRREPGHAEAWRARAQLARARGDMRTSMQHLAKALAADPRNATAWADLGEIYLEMGRPDQTRQAMERALTLAPQDARHWHVVGMALHAERRHADAIAAFERGLAQSGATPRQRVALAACLLDAGDPLRALAETGHALRDDPADAQAHFVAGTVHAAAGRHAEAIAAFAAASDCDPTLARAHYNRALALDELGEADAAAQACAAALAIDADLWPALAQLVFIKRRLCDWNGLDAMSERLLAAVRNGAAGITPFSFLAEDASATDQLACARTQAAAVDAAVGGPHPTPAANAGSRGGPRVGFVSSGFNNHPTALLIAELVERLRDGPLRTVAYATTADDGGALRRRLRAAFGEFHEAHGLDPAALAARIRVDAIDVLFDLRGYGAGSASETFAMRPAPVQVNWLAYPGTSGASFIDYILADPQVLPATLRAGFSEAVVRLPSCFQPSDSTRSVAEPPARRACGLPATGTVFASFNNSYKIGPQVFGAWLRILAGVPDAVLWLLGEAQSTPARQLREQAALAGVDPARVVFQPKLPHERYLALYRHVDLFLDTWPYGAHTTASDALWAGAPMLTYSGRTFAARVGTSLLHALGLPGMAVGNVDDYVARAIELGRDPHLLAAQREALARARAQSSVFDMRRFARHFERAVALMHERACAGLAPTDFDLPPA